MLQELAIRNFAIIDDLHIRFSTGLTVLSGETGAGKSIIVNAVNLLLGRRASAKHIRSGSETAELEALFRITESSKANRILQSQGHDPSEELLIRRVIARNRRHSIYINGRLSTAAVLNGITGSLASISGQHAHQGLLQEERQLQILDQYAGLLDLRSQVDDLYHKMLPLIHKRDALVALRDRQDDHIQLLRFQRSEIQGAKIAPGEDVALEEERKRLKNSAYLMQTAQEVLGMLYSNPGAIVENLGIVGKQIGRAAQIDLQLSKQAEALSEVSIDLEEIVESVRGYLDSLELDEGRLEAIEDRLFVLQKLKRKYGGSLEAISTALTGIDRELSEVENISDSILQTESQIDRCAGRLASHVKRLSRERKKSAQTLSMRVVKELEDLGMAGTRFQIELLGIAADESTPDPLTVDGNAVTDTGTDRIVFRIAPNIGEGLKPLSHIVSGGELSRVVLAVKAVLAETESVEAIIFDEVDAGIGGKVAEVMGSKLTALSRHYQTICITHLPQIAKFADHHIRISKTLSEGRTITKMQPLTESERIEEIARMLGGATITRATLNHAREMLKTNG